MRVADGVAGHTQIIGLFDRQWASNRLASIDAGATRNPRPSTISPSKSYSAITSAPFEYLTEQGLQPNVSTHPWIGWRSIYVSDPDDHTIEFVCCDASLARRLGATHHRTRRNRYLPLRR
jgi:catechol 2,3-dioxygenase